MSAEVGINRNDVARQSCSEHIVLRHKHLNCFSVPWRCPGIWLDISANFFEHLEGQIAFFPF
jgi:hypothetical protein